MSSFAVPIIAPNSKVIAPTVTTINRAFGEASKIKFERVIRYTPAVTMVAAWISAETGVGPAIASPSQDCSGNCADLPAAANNNIAPIAVSAAGEACGAPALTPSKLTVPNCAKAIMIARDSPTSPTRLATKAFFAAVA